MDYTVNQHQKVNLDAHQNADGNSVIGGAIHQLTHNILNKAKRNAINAQSQIDLAKELAKLFDQIVSDFNALLNGLFMDPPILNVKALEKLGKDLNGMEGMKHQILGAGLSAAAQKALTSELDNALSTCTKTLLSVLPDKFTYTVPEHWVGGSHVGQIIPRKTYTIKDPIKQFLQDILNGHGQLSNQEIQQFATSVAGATNTILATLKKYGGLTDFLNQLTNAIEGASGAVDQAAGSAISMSEIMTAKLNWAVNIMQEIMSTASKFADKAFKVELQMQGRIRAN